MRNEFVEIIKDIVRMAKPEEREEILKAVMDDVKRSEGPTIVSFAKLMDMEFPKKDNVDLLKATIIQIFVRDIVNSYSPNDALEILFAHQKGGKGSRYLGDYLKIIHPCEIPIDNDSAIHHK